MANLVETVEWVEGIYQLETTDLVEGGPDGVDNIQAIALAKRTQFLKALILAAQDSLAGHEAASDPHPQYLTTAEGNSLIANAVSALVNSSPATLDTLNELAAALGDDPNFAASMATQLGNKQPLDATLTAIAALVTAADKLVYATGADTFATTTLTAFARTLLDDVDAATMRGTLGIETLVFTSLLSANGYQKLPSGLIIQWGSGSYQRSTSYSFPIAFPNTLFSMLCVHKGTNNTANGYVEGASTNNTSFRLNWQSATNPETFYWFAIGN